MRATIKMPALALSLVLGCALFAVLNITHPPKTEAAYEAGHLIDDGELLDANSMSISEIQAFLVGKNSGLKSMSFTLSCYGSASKERQLYTAAGARCDTPIPASEVIYYASQIYGINPKVTLVKMQKEQSLTTAPNPTSWQLNQAMGYACPTSGGCGSSTFPYQIDSGVWAIRYHFERARGNNTWWNNNSWSSCGGDTKYRKPSAYPQQNVRFYDEADRNYTTVFIENAATSSFYCYTPHVFNNFPGCIAVYGFSYTSSYPTIGSTGNCYAGSYNFVRFYELWFGSTNGTYPQLDQSSGGPRWMVIKNETQKRIPSTGEPSYDTNDTLIPVGTQLKFVDKIWSNNQWYLRTEYDATRKFFKAIPQNDVTDITSLPFDEPRYMMLTEESFKVNPRNGRTIGSTFPKDQVIKFSHKFLINGTWYYQTQFDSTNDQIQAFPATNISNIVFQTLETARPMTIAEGARIINIRSGSVESTQDSRVDKGFVDKILVNGKWYLRTKDDADAARPYGISFDELMPIPIHINQTPYRVAIKEDTHKRSFIDGSIIDSAMLTKDQEILITDFATINGVVYYRSSNDSKNNAQFGILASETNLKSLDFIPLSNPRSLTLKTSTQKTNLFTKDLTGTALQAGSSLYFRTKVEIDGVWYLRTNFDTNNSLYYGIKAQQLVIN